MCTFWLISRILPQILSQSYLAAVSVSWSFSHALRFTPIRFSACSKPVSKSIQTATSQDDVDRGGVQISELSIESQ